MSAFTLWGGGPRYSSKPVLSVVEGLSRTVGDVNSTLACALVCAKIGVRVAHLEAGRRSFDPSTVLRTAPWQVYPERSRGAQGRPCLTLRKNTERPVTVTRGTNTIVGCDPRRMANDKVMDVLGYQALQPVASIGANCREATRAESRKDYTQIQRPTCSGEGRNHSVGMGGVQWRKVRQ